MTKQARNAKARLRAAQLETETAAVRLQRDVAVVRAFFARHRTACIVAGGLLGGIVLSSLPKRMWSRFGAIAGASAAAIARSVLTPMIAGAFVARTAAAPPAEGAPASTALH